MWEPAHAIVGEPLPHVFPSPSWPSPFHPQHLTPSASVSAQVWSSPTAIAAIPLERPETSTGVDLETVVPSPSWPQELSPQHLTPPDLISAQVPLLEVTSPVSPGTPTGPNVQPHHLTS